MNVKIQGSDPINIELEGIEFMLHNYSDLGAVLHFTLTKEQAEDLKKKLEFQLSVPNKIWIAPKQIEKKIPIVYAPLPSTSEYLACNKPKAPAFGEGVSEDFEIRDLFADLDRKGV